MPEKLIIIGAAGDGRNVAEMIQEYLNDKWEIVGFLDDDDEKQNTVINGIPVIGKSTDINKYADCKVIILVNNSQTLYFKKILMQKLGIRDSQLATIIHPKANISKSVRIGNGTVILAGSTIMANAVIGINCYIASNVNIGHDTVIGDYNFIAPLTGIPGFVNTEEGVYIGISSSVRGGITLGEWSIVGMGSVVLADVEPYNVVGGNPAKVIKKREIRK